MLDIEPIHSTPPLADQTHRVTPISPPAETSIKPGAIVVLSPAALKLSRDLQSVQTDPDKDPSARFDASVQLRQLAAEIVIRK